MQDLRLLTPRLELVSATLELAQVEISDLTAFARMLNAPRPASWPPPLNDENSQQSFLKSLQRAEAKDFGWFLWFCIRREPRELLGNVGFKGSPENGLVEIGYSLVEKYHGNGYCTEAVRALIGWAFEHGAVQTIVGPHSTGTDALDSRDGEMRVRIRR
jgi:[ribosomal protein S5]-alanine N-acetyltransferase